MSEIFLFTRTSLQKYQEQIDGVVKTIDDLNSQMQAALQDSGDSWHDNFTYDELNRQISMNNKRLADLKKPLSNYKVLDGIPEKNKVAIGSTVTLEINGKEKILTIEGFGYSDIKNGIISYNTPMGAKLLGSVVGIFVEVNNSKILIKSID